MILSKNLPHIPFTLNVGSNPETNPQTMLPNHFKEFYEVIVAFKIELALNWLMDVPKNISLDEVQTTLFGLFNDFWPHLKSMHITKFKLRAGF